MPHNNEELEKYTGFYTSKQNPLKITVSKDNAKLTVQAEGEESFPFEEIERDKFIFFLSGILIEFNTRKKELILKLGKKIFFLKERNVIMA